MSHICLLDSSINKCKYFDKSCDGCNAPNDKCGMLKTAEYEAKKKYERKTRWYEEYYR